MRVSDVTTQFPDKVAIQALIDELKAYIDGIATGNIDLSDYVTKSELQAKLDALDINIDLSSYATKEELTNAINSIDLSAYALKTEIPSLDGYATTEYVDNAIANVPSGGTVDLSNYYTKDEVYSKSETDALIPTVTDGVDGITPHIDETTKHWMIGDTDTGVMAEGVNGSDGVSPTVTVTKEGKVATITCTDVNGTTTATISDGADGQGGGGSSSSGGSSNVYSTTETVVGTWIDGKPIYRKVVNYTEAISHNTYTTFLSDIENIESIIYLGGMVNDRNILRYPVPFYAASNTYCWVAYNLKNNYFIVQLNIGNAGVSGIRIVIEYTKTSDATIS